MQKAQYGILRFAKYKGPEISNIEAHNERKKEKYASNPDIDNSRRNLNYHLIEPVGKYRAESNRLIEEYGCRTRKDSVRVVEVLITATPEFFKGKKKSEIRAYFQTALEFIEKYQDCVSQRIISGVTIFRHRKNLKRNARNILILASGLSHFWMEIQILIFMMVLKHWLKIIGIVYNLTSVLIIRTGSYLNLSYWMSNNSFPFFRSNLSCIRQIYFMM